MAKKFDKISRATPQQKVTARADAAREAKRMGLTDLRRTRQLSQQELAERLGVDQGSISRIEHQSDMYVRSLRRFVEAAGGSLHIIVKFPDENSIELDGFGDIESPTKRFQETGRR